MAPPPEHVAKALRERGELSHAQLDRLLQLAGHTAQREVVLAALDPQRTGKINPETLLGWLYRQDQQEPQAVAAEVAVKPSASAWVAKDVERMKELMSGKETLETGEHRTDLQEAFAEFTHMAAQLAEDFLSRGKNPQAEAFIEQVCVENILQGAIFVGHEKTDLDSVAGAMGAACLFRGIAARAERELNGEILYALKFAGLEQPPYFDDIPGAVTPDADGNLTNVCLVDHNEEKQMVESLRKDPTRSKRICGLIDHHCLSESFSSEVPVFMDIRPWGSMSTIVAHSFIRGNRPMPKAIARILVSAILSDTLNLRSVTTTNADKMMVTLLSILGEVEDVDVLARGMFRAKTEWIVNLGAYEMTRGDQKDFTCCGWKVGIAVLEVTDTAPVLAVADKLIMELRILKIEKGAKDGSHDRRRELDFAFLFVVDVTQQRSQLLICGGRELHLAQMAFPGCVLHAAKPGLQAPGEIVQVDQTLMEVGPIVSRKAQFVPAFFQALKAGFKCHKTPMSEVSEEIALQEPEDEVFKAMAKMAKKSYHNSICVVRDYSDLMGAFSKKAVK